MMRLLIFFLMIWPFCLEAQLPVEIELVQGERFKNNKRFLRVAGMCNEKVLTLMNEGGRYWLHRFDGNMNKEAEHQIDLELKGKKLELKAVLVNQCEVLIFTSFKNRKHEVFYFIEQRLNTQDFSPVGEPRVLASVPYSSNTAYPEVLVRKSDNEKYVAFLFRLNQKQSLGHPLQAHLFDLEADTSVVHTLGFGRGNSDPEIWDMKLSNEGQLFVLGGSSLHRRRLGSYGKRSVAYLHAVSVSGLHSYTTDFQYRRIYDAALDYSSGRLLCSYLSAAKKKSELAVLNLFFSPELQPGTQNRFVLHVDSLLSSAAYKKLPQPLKKRSRQSPELSYSIRTLRFMGDDAIHMSFEQQYNFIVSDHPDASDYFSSSYQYNHIFEVEMDAEGGLDETHLYPKCQFGNSRYYFSYACLSTSSGGIFFYNEDFRNLAADGSVERCLDPGRKTFAVVAIMEEGKLVRKSLLGARYAGWMLVPDRSYYDEQSNSLYVYAHKRNIASLMKISL